jgi:hypothetical protein
MKKIILTALTALSLGVGVASAASPNANAANQQNSGDQFNYTRGGGG